MRRGTLETDRGDREKETSGCSTPPLPPPPPSPSSLPTSRYGVVKICKVSSDKRPF